MKTFQYKDWSEDMLASKAESITAEFECELVTLYRNAELGEIDNYDAMIDKVTEVGSTHAATLCDMGRIVDERQFYGYAIEALEAAKGEYSLQEHARQWLDTMTALCRIQ